MRVRILKRKNIFFFYVLFFVGFNSKVFGAPGDRGVTVGKGDDSGIQVTSLVGDFFLSSDCSGGSYGASTITATKTLTEGRTYYTDAGALFQFNYVATLDAENVHSARISLFGSGTQTITYCIPSLVCASNSCQSVTTNVCGSASNWTANCP